MCLLIALGRYFCLSYVLVIYDLNTKFTGVGAQRATFFFFLLLMATPVAYGSSQARSQIGVAAASLHYSHSNAGSELHLQPTPQLMATLILNLLREARD